MIPLSPGKYTDGTPIDYSAAGMDRFWAAAAEAGLPIGFDIGEVPGIGRARGLRHFLPRPGGAVPPRARQPDLQRYPRSSPDPAGRLRRRRDQLHAWGAAGRRAEFRPASRDLRHSTEAPRPSHYWRENLYAAFQTAAIGLALLDHVGADRVMWAQDYPHGEGTFGYTAGALRAVIEATSEQNARLILGDSATSLYGLG